MGDDEEGTAGATTRRSVRVSSRSGRVDVIAEARSDVVARKGGRLVVLDEGDDRPPSRPDPPHSS